MPQPLGSVHSPDWKFWRSAIANGHAAFLVGAGVSADAPSLLPLAAGLIEHLVAPALSALTLRPSTSKRVLGAITRLRPEVVADVFLEHLGVGSLSPLNSVLRAEPNGWHHLLAFAIARGCNVITPNFDVLIEEACDRQAIRFRRIARSSEAKTLLPCSDAPQHLLLKIHGSLPDTASTADLSSLALALQQVGTGLRKPMADLLQAAIADRPLIVVGYAGRDDFDIVPALRQMPHAAPTLWIAHDPARRDLRPLGDSEKTWHPAAAARHCCGLWTGPTQIVRGRTASARALLASGPVRNGRQPGRAHVPGVLSHQRSNVVRLTQALVYSLIECRATALALEVIDQIVAQDASGPHSAAILLRDKAVVLEKDGRDLEAAERVADQAVQYAALDQRRRPAVLALALDQRGVIARRRGQHAKAERLYALGLRTLPTKRPKWLHMQIRAHRAVALDYLKRHSLALREHQAVARYERGRGDLRGLVKTLNNIGIVYESLDKVTLAIQYFSDSIARKKQLGDSRGIAQSLHNLGRLHFRRRRFDEAFDAFTESLRLRKGIGRDRHGVAQSLIALARVALKRRQLRDARAFAVEAHRVMLKARDSRGIAMAQDVIRELRQAALRTR